MGRQCQFADVSVDLTRRHERFHRKIRATHGIPEEQALEIRRLAHDLSNALEIVVQTSYLLSMAELKDPAAEWLRMLDSGVNKALESNKQLREYIKLHTPKYGGSLPLPSTFLVKSSAISLDLGLD